MTGVELPLVRPAESIGSCPLLLLVGVAFPPKSAGPGDRANGVGDVGESREDKFAGPEMLLVKDEGVNENGERLLDDLVRLFTLSK